MLAISDIQAATHGASEADDAAQFMLRPSRTGWQLVGEDDEVWFRAPGVHGRRECLEFARAAGVLTLSN